MYQPSLKVLLYQMSTTVWSSCLTIISSSSSQSSEPLPCFDTLVERDIKTHKNHVPAIIKGSPLRDVYHSLVVLSYLRDYRQKPLIVAVTSTDKKAFSTIVKPGHKADVTLTGFWYQ